MLWLINPLQLTSIAAMIKHLWDLTQHLRSVNTHSRLASEILEEGVNCVKHCKNLIRSDWVMHFTLNPCCWLLRFWRADFLSPCWNTCGMFSLCCGKQNDSKHLELTRNLHGVCWRKERKGLKRRGNSEETQKVPGRTNTKSSQVI